MALEIKTNLAALRAQRQFSENTDHLKSSMERLSSGLRINRSSDDASGLAISERLRSRIRSLDAAKRNASDAVSFIQTADGQFNEVANIVMRLRELTTQAGSDTLSNRDRMYLDKEFQQLREEAGRIMQSTEFNGIKLFGGGLNEKTMQIFVGASNRGEDYSGNLPDYESHDPDILKFDLSGLGDLLEKMSAITQDDISIVPSDEEGGAADLGPHGTNDLMVRFDNAINGIAGFRSAMGGLQSRLNSTLSSIDISSENLAATRSRIVDVDYAQETANLAKARILSQAGVSVLAQANAAPEMIINLLR